LDGKKDICPINKRLILIHRGSLPEQVQNDLNEGEPVDSGLPEKKQLLSRRGSCSYWSKIYLCNFAYVQVCRSHSGEVLTELCRDCETIFCGFCSEHAEHHTEQLTDTAISKQRDELFQLLHTVGEPVTKVLQSLNTVQAVMKQLGENHASSRREVDRVFDNLLAVLERQRQLALSELDHVFETKDIVLQQQASIR